MFFASYVFKLQSYTIPSYIYIYTLNSHNIKLNSILVIGIVTNIHAVLNEVFLFLKQNLVPGFTSASYSE